MSLLLIGKTPFTEYRCFLLPGQSVSVGRSPWADFCLADDDQLADLHWQVTYDSKKRLKIQSPSAASEELVGQWTPLPSGREYRQVVAGQSRLVFERMVESSTAVRHEQNRTETQTGIGLPDTERSFTPEDLEQLRALGLTSAGLELINGLDEQSAIRKLVDSNLLEDALRLAAFELPTQERLQWCYYLLRARQLHFTPIQAERIEAWLAEPNETGRIAIAASHDWSRNQSSVDWLLTCIIWTGGSLSSGAVKVPPTDQMIVTGVVTALSIEAAMSGSDEFVRQAIIGAIALLQQVSALRLGGKHERSLGEDGFAPVA